MKKRREGWRERGREGGRTCLTTDCDENGISTESGGPARNNLPPEHLREGKSEEGEREGKKEGGNKVSIINYRRGRVGGGGREAAGEGGRRGDNLRTSPHPQARHGPRPQARMVFLDRDGDSDGRGRGRERGAGGGEGMVGFVFVGGGDYADAGCEEREDGREG